MATKCKQCNGPNPNPRSGWCSYRCKVDTELARRRAPRNAEGVTCCQECGKPVGPRAGKKFCSTRCGRNARARRHTLVQYERGTPRIRDRRKPAEPPAEDEFAPLPIACKFCAFARQNHQAASGWECRGGTMAEGVLMSCRPYSERNHYEPRRITA